jgi:hypothetical protein
MSETPYLSWVVVNRNDGYPADQQTRINFFIEFLGSLDRRFPGTFELVLCDWNPPSPDHTILSGFDWSPIENLTVVTVPAEIHAELVNGATTNLVFPWANNVALRAASGMFIGRLNPDICISRGITNFIGEHRFSPDYFYRADRCNYRPDFAKIRNMDTIDKFARSQALSLARRGHDRMDPIQIEIMAGTPVEQWRGSSAIEGEVETGSPPMIVGGDDEAEAINRRFTEFLREVRSGQVEPHHVYKIFGLHTNACGDFIVASRQALEEIRGFPETTAFTEHEDTYAVVQLRAKGYQQAIFRLPECVYHADHDRASLGSRPEEVPFEEHEKVWSDMLQGKRTTYFNGPDWGLVEHELPVIKMRFGQRV